MEKVMCHIVITLTDQGIGKIYTLQVTQALRETGSIYFSYFSNLCVILLILM